MGSSKLISQFAVLAHAELLLYLVEAEDDFTPSKLPSKLNPEVLTCLPS